MQYKIYSTEKLKVFLKADYQAYKKKCALQETIKDWDGATCSCQIHAGKVCKSAEEDKLIA